MADKSLIEWTDATWNPITGCSIVDAGCTNCYAMGLAASRMKNHPSRTGLTRPSGNRHVWTGEVRFNHQWLEQPLRWTKPRMIFVCAHGDLFHEKVPDNWIDRVFAVMALCPQHTFQVLTKRPERTATYLDRACGRIGDRAMDLRKSDLAKRRGMGPNGLGPLAHIKPGMAWWPLPNVWLGTSISDQASADARVPHVLKAPATVRFLSCEPLLGPVDLKDIADGTQHFDALERVSKPADEDPYKGASIDWVIAGGESGPNARPMHPEWARSLRDQCQDAGVPFLFKQWGEWMPIPAEHHPIMYAGGGGVTSTTFKHDGQQTVKVGKKTSGRLLDGREWNEFPQSPARGGTGPGLLLK